VTTLLTWEPRRVRVLLAKAIVGIASVFMLTAILQGVMIAALSAMASLNGSVAGAEGWLTETAAVALRVSVLAAIASAVGSPSPPWVATPRPRSAQGSRTSWSSRTSCGG
jgi:hypothetical protein